MGRRHSHAGRLEPGDILSSWRAVSGRGVTAQALRLRLAEIVAEPRDTPVTYGDDVLPVLPKVPAAVLVPVVLGATPGVLLTKRTAHLRSHAGQVSFPGGRIDPADSGPEAAA